MAQWRCSAGANPGELLFSCDSSRADQCRVLVCIQTFSGRDVCSQWTDLLRSLFIEADHADDFDEVQHVEGGGKTRRAAGGHHVTGSGDVISKNFVGMFTQEHAACVDHFFSPGGWVFYRKGQV